MIGSTYDSMYDNMYHNIHHSDTMEYIHQSYNITDHPTIPSYMYMIDLIGNYIHVYYIGMDHNYNHYSYMDYSYVFHSM